MHWNAHFTHDELSDIPMTIQVDRTRPTVPRPPLPSRSTILTYTCIRSPPQILAVRDGRQWGQQAVDSLVSSVISGAAPSLILVTWGDSLRVRRQEMSTPSAVTLECLVFFSLLDPIHHEVGKVQQTSRRKQRQSILGVGPDWKDVHSGL